MPGEKWVFSFFNWIDFWQDQIDVSQSESSSISRRKRVIFKFELWLAGIMSGLFAASNGRKLQQCGIKQTPCLGPHSHVPFVINQLEAGTADLRSQITNYLCYDRQIAKFFYRTIVTLKLVQNSNILDLSSLLNFVITLGNRQRKLSILN